MPVLNGKRYIAGAIESILTQTYGNVELVVVDDGSTDETYAMVEPYFHKLNIKYVSHPARQGIPASMNDGVRHSTGELIAFLDHDDIWLPEMLETQVAYLESHPDVGMVHSDFQTIDAEGRIIEDSVAKCRNRVRVSGSVFPQLFMDCFIVGNSVLIRKECFNRLGYFDESLRFGDYDMWLRIARRYKVDYVPKVLTAYRQHATQSTRAVSAGRPEEDCVVLAVIENTLRLCPEIRQELGRTTINRRFASIYFDMAYASFAAGSFASLRSCMRKAIHYWPTNHKYYCYLLASFLPPRFARVLRSSWQRVRGCLSSANDMGQLDRVTHVGHS